MLDFKDLLLVGIERNMVRSCIFVVILIVNDLIHINDQI